MLSAEDWIQRLQLEPHPEGGWFRRIYTDPRTVATDKGARAAASSIHYLLSREAPLGRLHRNRSTILHYLQAGGPIDYWLLGPDGALQQISLGTAPGQQLFFEAPGGVWKGTRLAAGADYALVSEVVLPGFDFADHEYMDRSQLEALPTNLQETLTAFVV